MASVALRKSKPEIKGNPNRIGGRPQKDEILGATRGVGTIVETDLTGVTSYVTLLVLEEGTLTLDADMEVL